MKKLLFSTVLAGSMAIAAVANAAKQDGPLSKLPAADASMAHAALAQEHQKNKPLFDKMKSLHHERDAIVAADKFDANAYLAKSAAIEQVQQQIHSADNQTWASILAKLPANERKSLSGGDHHKGHRQ